MGEAISPRVRLFPLRVRLFQDITSPWAPVGAKKNLTPKLFPSFQHDMISLVFLVVFLLDTDVNGFSDSLDLLMIMGPWHLVDNWIQACQ